MAKRLAGRCGYPKDDPFRVTLHPDRLPEPLHWRKPCRVFVCSMGDLFHEKVPFDFIDQAWAVTALCPQHTFTVLTKRPDRMLEYLVSPARHNAIELAAESIRYGHPSLGGAHVLRDLPLPNVHLGVSVEDQNTLDERLRWLMQCPAAVRFVSYEPALASAEFAPWLDRLDGVIAGGETGPGARPAHPDWFRKVRDDCKAAGVPFFLKQLGEWVHERSLAVKVFQDADGKYTVAGFEGLSHPPNRGTPLHQWPDGSWSCRVGKKLAGRLLDGREHNDLPGTAEGGE